MTRPAINDWHLWSEVTRTVSPLIRRAPGPKREPSDKANPPEGTSVAQGPREGGRLFRQQQGSAGQVWSPGATPIHHQISHPNASIEPKLRRRVQRGQLPIDARLDLHGLRQDEARSALHHFIHRAMDRGDRTLLIITGKGLKKTDPTTIFERGVLRHMLPIWLNEPSLKPYVAGYEISAQQHGGEGAYYVRLKRA